MFFKKSVRFYENLPRLVFGAIAALTVLALVSILVFLLMNGIGAFKEIGISEFFFGSNWNPTSFHSPSWGILSLVASTFMISILALFIALPFGLSIAIYLSELASRRKREILKPLIEMISSIPSVVLGFLGILFLAPSVAKIFNLSNGLNTLTASILVAIAALPTIASICEDALSSVSLGLRETSFALGATKWTTIKRIVLPAAGSGITAATMLGLGRIIGETMIVLMVAGNSRAFSFSFLEPIRPMTSSIAIEIKEVVVGSLHSESLFAIGFTLFVITFIINLLADILIHKNYSYEN
ncbi:MAG: phosphate ABC transporter permease subunit PstC [Candidatus Paceibacterota bacterium]